MSASFLPSANVALEIRPATPEDVPTLGAVNQSPGRV